MTVEAAPEEAEEAEEAAEAEEAEDEATGGAVADEEVSTTR